MRVGHGRKLGKRPWPLITRYRKTSTVTRDDPPNVAIEKKGPPDKAAAPKRAARSRFRTVMAGGLLACSIALGGTAWVMWMRGAAPNPGATVISAGESQTREEIQAQLDREVEENMMTVSVLPTLRLDEESGELTAGLENDGANRFAQRFSISQDEEQVFVSDPVMPGERLEAVMAPKARTGTAKIEIQALDAETLKAHGSPTAVEVSVASATES